MMLDAKNMVLGYNQAITDPISLTIRESQWIGVIGDNGTGKSTFFKTLLGLIKPLSGTLTVLNDTNNKSNKNAAISYIPQEREIHLTDHMSGLSLIQNSYAGWKWGWPIANKTIYQRAMALLELVGAEKYMHQPFYHLSGGQKKRIFLAQALINQPKLLLLDEPLADLDPNAKQHFIKALQQIHQHENIGLLIISHDMHEIACHLDGFIHFKNRNAHFCLDLPCIREDAYVGL